MSKLEALTFVGQVIGVASTILMGYVFYNELFFRRGVLFIEPNLGIASIEFLMVAIGLIAQCFVLVAYVVFTGKSDKKEPTGFPKSDRAYA